MRKSKCRTSHAGQTKGVGETVQKRFVEGILVKMTGMMEESQAYWLLRENIALMNSQFPCEKAFTRK